MTIEDRIAGRKFGRELLELIDLEESTDWMVGIARALREWSDQILGQPYTEARVMSETESRRYEAQFMRFGVHQGKPVSEVPLDYLQWLADSQNELVAYLRSDVGRKRQDSEWS